MASEFMWRRVSEEELKKIKKQAKEIMDDFSKEISKIKLPEEGFAIKRNKSKRNENTEEAPEMDRNIFFKNAPQSGENFIFVEKKKW